MIFDYDAIIEKYGIDIDIVTENNSADEEKEEQKTPSTPPPPSISFPDDDE